MVSALNTYPVNTTPRSVADMLLALCTDKLECDGEIWELTQICTSHFTAHISV